MKLFGKRKIIILVICIVIGGFLRLYNIESNPPGVHADEADSGYNAYSIFKTGRDYYGNFLPIQITGFAENYRTPISTYLTVPFVGILGLSILSIRLPAVILGTIFIYLMYLLSKNLFKSDRVGIIAAFITALNPWAVHISRAYADHILALVFVIFGLVLITGKRSLVTMGIAGVALGLALFSYHAPKIFLPLFLPILIFYFGRNVFREFFKFFLVFFIFGLFILIVFLLSIFQRGGREFEIVSIFDGARATQQIDKERRVTEAPLVVSSLFHNKPLYYGKELLRNMGRSLSFNYLYLDGDNNLTAWIGDRGLFYIIESPFLLLGIFFLFQRNKKLGILFLFWIVFSVVPGSITNNQMFTYRNIYLMPSMLLLTSYGVDGAFKFLKPRKLTFLVFVVCVFLYAFAVVGHYFHYFYDYPIYSRPWWAADQRDAILYLVQNKQKYSYIYVRGGRDWPLLYAFYQKVEPKIFSESLRGARRINNVEVITMDKFRFGNFMVRNLKNSSSLFPKSSLYLGYPDDFPKEKAFHVILSKEDWGMVYKFIEIK